jgi:transcriptional regulator with XRE-family HTH domain
MKNYYGNGIQFYRRILGVKQWVLAEHLGMSRQNLSEIEQNKRKISDDKIDLAAAFLKTTPEKIKDFSGEIIFDNQQQEEQYNNGTVALPESILNKLADTLEASQQSLQTQGELFKNILNAFISIQSQTSDIQARLTLLEKYSKDTSLHSNK